MKLIFCFILLFLISIKHAYSQTITTQQNQTYIIPPFNYITTSQTTETRVRCSTNNQQDSSPIWVDPSSFPVPVFSAQNQQEIYVINETLNSTILVVINGSTQYTEGLYACVIVSPSPPKMKSIYIYNNQPFLALALTPSVSSVIVQLAESNMPHSTIECTISGYPPPTVTINVANNNQMTLPLTLSSLSAGVYNITCLAANSYTSQFNQLLVVILPLPNILFLPYMVINSTSANLEVSSRDNQSDVFYIRAGTPLKITCPASAYSNYAVVVWNVPSGVNLSLPSNDVLVSGISLGEVGDYTCGYNDNNYTVEVRISNGRVVKENIGSLNDILQPNRVHTLQSDSVLIGFGVQDSSSVQNQVGWFNESANTKITESTFNSLYQVIEHSLARYTLRLVNAPVSLSGNFSFRYLNSTGGAKQLLFTINITTPTPTTTTPTTTPPTTTTTPSTTTSQTTSTSTIINTTVSTVTSNNTTLPVMSTTNTVTSQSNGTTFSFTSNIAVTSSNPSSVTSSNPSSVTTTSNTPIYTNSTLGPASPLAISESLLLLIIIVSIMVLIMAAMCVTACIVCCCIRWRLRYNNASKAEVLNNSDAEKNGTHSVDIPLKNYSRSLIFSYRDEFKDLPPSENKSQLVGLLNENIYQNRDPNILPNDDSRVIMDPDPEFGIGNYINASFINGAAVRNRYIAAQAPMRDLTYVFWKMVWDHDVKVIVMLTRLAEFGLAQCYNYWPNDRISQTYGRVIVDVMDVREFKDCVVRTLKLQLLFQGISRYVKHYQFLSWAEAHPPEYPTSVITFTRRIRNFVKENSIITPIVVHCNTGIGRTGAWIAIDILWDKLDWEESSLNLDVPTVCSILRLQRKDIICKEEDYVFIRQTIDELIYTGNTEVAIVDYMIYFQAMTDVQNNSISQIAAEFGRLQVVYKEGQLKSADNQVNAAKNRSLHCVPVENSRVILPKLLREDHSDYINASYIDGYSRRNQFIATQTPLKDTIEDFWRMIMQTRCELIIMFDSPPKYSTSRKSTPYFPLAEGERLFGDYEVKLLTGTAFNTDNDFVYSTMTVRNTRNENEVGIRIHHYQFSKIVDYNNDDVISSYSSMHNLIQNIKRKYSELSHGGPITVHDVTGGGWSAVFIACVIIFDRLEAESYVDVYNTVKSMRFSRTNMVQTLEQYQYIFSLILENFYPSIVNYEQTV